MMAVGGADAIAPPRRRLSSLLLLGVYAAPLVFVWLLFRRGYSPALRRSGLAWLAFNLMPLAAVMLGG